MGVDGRTRGVKEILVDAFSQRPRQFRPLDELTREVQRHGLYTETDFARAQSELLGRWLINPPFTSIHVPGQGPLFGLSKWVPQYFEKPKRLTAPSGQSIHTETSTDTGEGRRRRRQEARVDGRHSFKLTSHALKHGYMVLPEAVTNALLRAGETPKLTMVWTYGGNRIPVWVHRDYHAAYGLAEWYGDNDLRPGDEVIMEVDSGAQHLRIWTSWDLNFDKFNRETAALSDVDRFDRAKSSRLSVRDLAYLYLRSEDENRGLDQIATAVREARPEVANGSVAAALSRHKHIFARCGRAKWGLLEWGLDNIEILTPGAPSRPEVPSSTDDLLQDQRRRVDAEYLLEYIHEHDLIYGAIRLAEGQPLTAAEIAEHVASELGVQAKLLLRMSFLETKDERIIRLPDGTFTLAKRDVEDAPDMRPSSEFPPPLEPEDVIPPERIAAPTAEECDMAVERQPVEKGGPAAPTRGPPPRSASRVPAARLLLEFLVWLKAVLVDRVRQPK